jgi:hypothetical protein
MSQTTRVVYKVPIAMAPGARAKIIKRVPSQHCWELWIAVRDMSVPDAQWEGTYLKLHDTGAVERVTVYEDGTTHIMGIKDED